MTDTAEELIRDAHGDPIARVRRGSGPVLAVALHAGHAVRSQLDRYLAISSDDRLREEDPFTARMAPEGITLVEVVRSRYEVDLNRPRERAVYQGADDAWGLQLYRDELPAQEAQYSIGVYEAFYDAMLEMLGAAVREHGRFVVLDLHAYNHRRDGADGPDAPIADNPDVNLGTGRFDRTRWAGVTDAFIETIDACGLDCRENVRFQGGHLSQWVADEFPDTGVALAIEFKKTYMDEWTGLPDDAAIARRRDALAAATRAIREVLEG